MVPAPMRPPAASSGAILPDGSLNADRLQREIANEVASDARYRAEDGMKKRAIHMSRDYDEFKSFVAASQLKPVGRNDVADLFAGAGGAGAGRVPKNGSLRGAAGAAGPKELSRRRRGEKKKGDGTNATASRRATSSIRSHADLEREWRRRLCGARPSEALRFLASTIPAEKEEDGGGGGGGGECDGAGGEGRRPRRKPQLALAPEDVPRTVLRVEADASALGGIVGALRCLAEGARPSAASPSSSGGSLSSPSDDGPILAEVDANLAGLDGDDGDGDWRMRRRARFAYRWMNALTRCGRFDLNISFLDREQREGTETICSFLEDHADDDDVAGGGGGGGGGAAGAAVAFTRKDVEGLRCAYLR